MEGEASVRVVAEWHNRALAEYRSAAVTAQLLHCMIQVGLPQELLDTAIRIVGDELVHAQLSADVLEALGGSWQATPVDTAMLAEPVGESPLATLIDSLVPNFLLGETLAVPLFNAMRKNTTHPTALLALERILRDEAVHRGFGWDVLDVLVELPGVRERIQDGLSEHLTRFRDAYGEVQGMDCTAEELGAGLLNPADWRRIHDSTIAGDIRARFGRVGIQVQQPH